MLADELDAREVLQRCSRTGASVKTAASAHEAVRGLSKADSCQDIIVSDIGMPIRRLRLHGAGAKLEGPVATVPAAALTALARVETASVR